MPVVTEKERGQGVPFSRIRRITGYLTGDLSTWGSAKKHEESDRVKHVKLSNSASTINERVQSCSVCDV